MIRTVQSLNNFGKYFTSICYYLTLIIVAIDDEQAKDIIALSAMYKITYIHKIIKSTVLKMYY